MSCEDFIISELSRHGIEYGFTKNDITVACPFHEHSGMKRKLGFKRDSEIGAMYCWVCGIRGTWNTYAEKMGFALIKAGATAERGDIRSLLREFEDYEKKQPVYVTDLPPGVTPWEEGWRGLSADFLATIPSFRWYDKKSGYRILWPVVQRSRLYGFTSARADPTDETLQPKTRNLGGLPTSRVMFPFDHYLIKDRVVLVEGQFDALRLLSYGIPALSIMGTNQWISEESSGRLKTNLLLSKGITRVVIAMDGDDAGWQCTREVHRSLNKEIDTRVMEFPDPPKGSDIDCYDPGNAPTKYLRVIKRMLE